MNNGVMTNDDFDELSGQLEHLGIICNKQEEEIRYMHDFISWMHLEAMYASFRKNAYEFQPEDGSFSHYTMDDSCGILDIVCS